MTSPRLGRWVLAAVVLLVVLVGGGLVGFRMILGVLKGKVVEALGPGSEIEDGVVELFDATVAQPPLKIRLEKIQASVRNVLVPALTGNSQFDVAAIVKGVQRDGRTRVAGWLEAATKNSSVKMELRYLDMVTFQLYLIKAAETRIQLFGGQKEN